MSRKKKFDPEAWSPYKPAPLELPDDAATAAPELHADACEIWDGMQWTIGGSIDLVRHVTMPKSFVRLARDWVRHLEMIVRRMIWILALSLNLRPARQRTHAAKTAPAASVFRRRSGHWADVRSWKVRFSMASVARERESRAGIWRPRPLDEIVALL